MRHTVVDTQSDVGECHTSHILCHCHAVAALGVGGLFDGDGEVLVDHGDGLEFEHVAQFPCPFGDETFDGMRHGIHACGSCEALGEGVHEFGIDDGDTRNVVGVDAYHLLLLLLVDDDIVDGGFGSSTSRGGQCNDGHGLLLGVRNALKRDDVLEFGIVAYDAHTLCGVHGAATADGDDEVSPRLLEGSNALLDIRDGGVGLHLVENGIGNAGLVEHVKHHLCNPELHQALVGDDECLVESETCHNSGQLLACTGTEV